MSKQYRIKYSTRYQNKCSKRVWKEEPPGLISASIGRVRKSHAKKRTAINVVALCDIDGKIVRKTKKVYIYSKDVGNVRLKLVEMPD